MANAKEVMIEAAKLAGVKAACRESLQFASNVAHYWINVGDGKIKQECFTEIRQHVSDAETLWLASQANPEGNAK